MAQQTVDNPLRSNYITSWDCMQYAFDISIFNPGGRRAGRHFACGCILWVVMVLKMHFPESELMKAATWKNETHTQL